MECVAVCPAQDALQLALPPRKLPGLKPVDAAARWRRRVLRPEAVAALLALLFVGLIAVARAAGHWQTGISQDTYKSLVPSADNYDH